MLQEFKILSAEIRGYFGLDDKRKAVLRIWLSCAWNYLFAVIKFATGFITWNGYFCINGLYTWLFGFAKRQFIAKEREKIVDEGLLLKKFRMMGVCVGLAGCSYIVYIGLFYLQENKRVYSMEEGICIALFSFIDIGMAFYNLLGKKRESKNDLLLFGKKLISIAAALPAMVMTETSLNSFASNQPTSFYDGMFGIGVGLVIIVIGIGMAVYSKKVKT
ncbi:hypothetical protein BAU15_10320 [Enterococcus sp. JM4C]|uniref:hypothetical protein n=1 Tax=Candidatus Enterococcus huntleyi TaxID=1857217 RepID=UPI00137ADA15|nr:hypothetical protein [Enterococcus sp. JM4C]KAF1296175.1 hypothetical protein BAU15_10320 [Enterococcus sp. JM4C]